MLVKDRFSIDDPKAYQSSKPHQYLIAYKFADEKYPQKGWKRLTGGTATVSCVHKILIEDDLLEITKILECHLRKQTTKWNGAKIIITAFSYFG